jgi:hypothetical protein
MEDSLSESIPRGKRRGTDDSLGRLRAAVKWASNKAIHMVTYGHLQRLRCLEGYYIRICICLER